MTLGEADSYPLALTALAESRLEELGQELATCRDRDRRLRLLAAERLAAQDMAKGLDLLERTFGGAIGEAVPLKATGTGGRVLDFPRPGLGPLAQRLVAAVADGAPLTKAELRSRVRGNQGDFLRGLREALAAGALQKEGAGSRARPFKYRR